MFGQPDDQQDAQIPEQSIDGALSDDQASDNNHDWQHPGKPLDPPAQDDNASDQTNNKPADNASDSAPNELIDIKQQALNQLSPLVDHLEQSPEDKFRTIMMMIQASDDQSKIKEAYAAAQAIEDEKTRAQALLDVINEINYFTQQHQS